MTDHKIYEMPFADVFSHHVAKIERCHFETSDLNTRHRATPLCA
jgi:hypothetical protein